MNNVLQLSDINDLMAEFIKQNNCYPTFLQIGKKQVKELEGLTYSVSYNKPTSIDTNTSLPKIDLSTWGLMLEKLEVDSFLGVR